MNLSRRSLAALLLAVTAPLSWAQNFPTKPIRIVVPNAPGGGADLTARTVGEKASQLLGQPIIIDNKPAAGGVVAGDTVAKAAPDGYNLLLISSGTAVSASLFKSLPYDTTKDFIPVAPLATFDLVIVAPPDGRFKTLKDLVAYAKAHPGTLNIGTPLPGTTQNLAAELFKSVAGIDVQIVPFKGTPDVIGALRGKQIDAGLDILGSLLSQIKAGGLHPLAITGDRRARLLPDVPTAQEQGVAGYSAASWNGLAVPAGTPKEVVVKLNKAFVDALNDPATKAKLEGLNLDPAPGTPEKAAAMLNGDIKRWGDVIKKANITLQ